MLIKDTIPFVDNTAAFPQSVDHHRGQQGISITMVNCQQLHIHNIYIPQSCSCSASHNVSITHLLSNNEMSVIVVDIDLNHSKLNTNTNGDERDEQLTDEMDIADNTIHNEN